MGFTGFFRLLQSEFCRRQRILQEIRSETQLFLSQIISRMIGIHYYFCLYVLGFPAGLSRPGKSREGPGMGRDGTGPRDLEGPVVLWSRD